MNDCRYIAELLPWLLNGTLAPDDRRQVNAHLAGCLACRQELKETVVAWNVFQTHLPSETLVDYAFEQSIAPPDRGLIEGHLATCEECSAELAMVRESRRLAEEEDVPAVLRKAFVPAAEKKKWREWFQFPSLVPVAVGLALAVVAAAAVWNLWRSQRANQARQEQSIAGLETENRQLRQTEAQLHGQLDQANQQLAQVQEQLRNLNAPQLNFPLRDIRPADPMQYKSAGQAADPVVNELEIPSSAKFVALILNSQSQESYRSYAIEMLDAQKNVKWNGVGLARNPSNDYTISLPADFLAPGASYTINVYGEGRGRRVRVESYRIRVKPRASGNSQ
jgi:hypothetical protein